MRFAAALVVLTAAASGRILACPICFQQTSGAATDGVRIAVIVLAGVTVGVLGGCAIFVLRFVRRARVVAHATTTAAIRDRLDRRDRPVAT